MHYLLFFLFSINIFASEVIELVGIHEEPPVAIVLDHDFEISGKTLEEIAAFYMIEDYDLEEFQRRMSTENRVFHVLNFISHFPPHIDDDFIGELHAGHLILQHEQQEALLEYALSNFSANEIKKALDENMFTEVEQWVYALKHGQKNRAEIAQRVINSAMSLDEKAIILAEYPNQNILGVNAIDLLKAAQVENVMTSIDGKNNSIGLFTEFVWTYLYKLEGTELFDEIIEMVLFKYYSEFQTDSNFYYAFLGGVFSKLKDQDASVKYIDDFSRAFLPYVRFGNDFVPYNYEMIAEIIYEMQKAKNDKALATFLYHLGHYAPQFIIPEIFHKNTLFDESLFTYFYEDKKGEMIFDYGRLRSFVQAEYKLAPLSNVRKCVTKILSLLNNI